MRRGHLAEGCTLLSFSYPSALRSGRGGWDLIRKWESAGWVLRSTRGSHSQLNHP